jgi:hypothetical protein
MTPPYWWPGWFGIFPPTLHRGAFSNFAFPFSPWHPTHTGVVAKQTMIYEFQRVQVGGLCEEWCLFCHISPRPNISPASALLPNLQASAERTKSQLSNACHMSRNGGVGAEVCLHKVKWDYLAGRGVSFSQGRPAGDSLFFGRHVYFLGWTPLRDPPPQK